MFTSLLTATKVPSIRESMASLCARSLLRPTVCRGLHATSKDVNLQWLLRERPKGIPEPSTWELVESPIISPSNGEALIEVEYVSLDPAMRGWINDVKSYIPPVGIGEVMRALTIGTVIESNTSELKPGDTVIGTGGVQNYHVTRAKDVKKVDPSLAPLPTLIGGLGMPGMTAYFGLLRVGKPIAGETVVVSAAAGAVGAVVSQVAKIKGCRVIGVAGGEEKCKYLTEELGLDGAIDYKAQNVYKALAQHCAKGIDVYFDNVGGDILDAALAKLNKGGRVALCGAISNYNATEMVGPKNYLSLLVNRATMQGFIVTDYAKDYQKAVVEMAAWHREGSLKFKEHIVEGITRFPSAFNMLFKGENFGKLVLKMR